MAAVLQDVAEEFNDSKPKINDFCAEVRITSASSADVASSLVGADADGPSRAHVWIPDSSIWVDQVRSIAPKERTVPKDNVSVASSPTVIAMPAPVANQISGSGGISWARMLRELENEQSLQIGFPDPTQNTTGVVTLLAVGQLIGNNPNARAKQVSIMRQLTGTGGTGKTMQDVFSKLPRSPESGEIQSSVAAVPTTEQSVWRYNANKPPVRLVALYPAEGALRLDYPYVVTADRQDAKRQKAAQRFLKELKSKDVRGTLQSNGFRSPDGRAGDVLNQENGANPQLPRATRKPDAESVAGVINAWRAVSLATRMLVLMDVSGSMTTRVPGINKTRMEVTLSAAFQGLGLLQDSSDLGLWTFSTKLDGNKDYRQLVPIGPLSQNIGTTSRRGVVGNLLTTIQATPGGATGLYDSILAAYKTVKDGYKANKVNSVLVFTDGKNEDPGSITLDALLAELKKQHDPSAPVPIYIVAFGPDTDIESAKKISELTTGAAYQANTPSEIGNVFLDAVGQRQCRPNC